MAFKPIKRKYKGISLSDYKWALDRKLDREACLDELLGQMEHLEQTGNFSEIGKLIKKNGLKAALHQGENYPGYYYSGRCQHCNKKVEWVSIEYFISIDGDVITRNFRNFKELNYFGYLLRAKVNPHDLREQLAQRVLKLSKEELETSFERFSSLIENDYVSDDTDPSVVALCNKHNIHENLIKELTRLIERFCGFYADYFKPDDIEYWISNRSKSIIPLNRRFFADQTVVYNRYAELNSV